MKQSGSKILVATNLSESSAHALEEAVRLAIGMDAEIRLIHVCEEMSEDVKVTLMMFMQDEKTRKAAVSQRLELYKTALSDHIEAFWDSMPEEIRKESKRISSAGVIEGFPAQVILSQAREHKCDMIVLGAHEHGFDHTFIGNVAKRVLRRADVPTLIVPCTQKR